MASVFSHAVAAAAIGTAFTHPRLPLRAWLLGAACAVFPDVDVVGIPLGIPFGGPLGHRGLTHSLAFAAALAALVVTVGFRERPAGHARWRLWLYLFLATASHGFFDALTDGGIGVAFWAPFDDSRYFLPWRPIVVSPIGLRPFFSLRGLRVIESELVWIWLPCAIFAGLTTVAALRRRAARG